MPETQITESRFAMWRAVFALAHADGVIVDEEIAFMDNILATYPFTEEQAAILREDMRVQGDAGEFFAQITDRQDKADFFEYARLIIWCDGNFDAQERSILDTLKGAHLQALDEGAMLGEVATTFDAEEKDLMKARMRQMYSALQQNKKQEEGGVFGALIRKMWADRDEPLEKMTNKDTKE